MRLAFAEAHLKTVSGVRPSSAAATLVGPRASEYHNDFAIEAIAATEDGRTPQFFQPATCDLQPVSVHVRQFLPSLLLLLMVFAPISLLANPAGGTATQGTATFNTSASTLTVRTSDRAAINWQSFNIGVGETTTFVQPSSSSVVWNRINDPNPSQILGSLNANGFVVFQNPNGLFIGGQAMISTHGLILTTSPIPVPDLASGGPWQFNALPPSAAIINYGQISVDSGGSLFLISH